MGVLLYTRRLNADNVVFVFYDTSYNIYNIESPNSDTDYPFYDEGDLITSTCIPSSTTLINFRAQLTAPYAYKEYIADSPICGFVGPTCDLALASVNTSDETTEDNNNGTANIFATSSYDIVSYTLSGAGDYSNSTGVFTGLVPGDYNYAVVDSNGCFISGTFTINPFDTTLTDLKYTLEFTGLQSDYDCRVEFHDKKNLHDTDVYPLSLTGGAIPVVRKTANSNEAKEEAICPTSLDISVMMDGSFTVEEFALSDERTWYIKYYVNNALKFQGWLLPDETDDEYKDPNYPIKLTATDGLLSLKGADYADATGVQEYGVFAWAQLVRNCLDQLDYDYGNTVLISSLCFNDTFDNQLWLNIGTWSDLLYDDNGKPKKTYDVLTILFRSMGLCLFQHNGTFFMVNWNDFYYIQNTIKQPEWYRAAWVFNADFTSVTNGDFTLLPRLATVGFQQEVKPINTNHPLRYDKAYSVLEASIDFKYYTLLYANPSFEIGAVAGQLPYYWKQEGAAFGTLETSTTAYTGNWVFAVTSHNELELSGLGIPTSYFTTGNFVDQISPGFVIDQGNKTVNLSFYWRPVYYAPDEQVIPAFIVVFIRDSDGKVFIYDTDGRFSGGTPNVWTEPTEANPYDLQLAIVPDNLQWNNYTLNTTELPGTGKIFVRLYGGIRVTLSGQVIFPQTAAYHTIQFDQFELTLGDASTGYNKQIGETHSVTNLTNFAKAEKKPVTLDLFTFPSNKRIAGNVFYGTDYLTGIVANTWNYRLTNPVVIDRLPAIQVRKIAKQYQRPAYIFEGDVLFQELNYFAVFLLMGYAGRLFMPYTITWDDKNGKANVVIVEINDSQPQNSYIYNAKYEKSARKIQ